MSQMPERPTTSKTKSTGVAAVDRALHIVATIEKNDDPLSLSELSRITGLYKSTVLRLLASLEKAALVTQRPDLHYELGPLAFRLGRAYDANHKLEEKVLATLYQLVDQGTQSASFHMRYNDHQRLCLFRVNSRHSILDNVKTGDLLPLECGAPAKTIRHFHPMSGGDIPYDSPLIFRSMGERDPACAAISTPVFSSHNLFLGALSLSGPYAQFHDEERITWMSGVLIKEAIALTEALGGTWPCSSLASLN